MFRHVWMYPSNGEVEVEKQQCEDEGKDITPYLNRFAKVAALDLEDPTNWPAAVAGTKQNGTLIAFPEATLAWGTITYIGVFDQAVGGNLLMRGALTAPKTIDIGDTAQFPPNNITVTLD